MKSIWDSRLWIRHDLISATETNALFAQSAGNKAHLGSHLLLYDEILVPTKDFGIVPIIAEWCGLNGLRHLLDSEAITFLWQELLLGYGKGLGIGPYTIDEPSSGWENMHQVARWGEMESAIEAQIEI